MNYETTGQKIWRVLYPLLIHIAVYILVMLGAGLVFQSAGKTGELLDQALTDYAWLTGILSTLISLVVLFFFYRKDYPVNISEYIKKPSGIISLVLAGVFASHGLSLLISLIGTASLVQDYQNVEQVIYSSGVWMVIIRAVILAPLFEELLFRGLIFRRLKEYTNFRAAAFVSSAIFAIYHLNLLQGIFAFLFGILLCFVYDRFNNIFASIIMHAAANLFSVAVTVIGLNYPVMWIYVLIMVVMLALSAALFGKVIPAVTKRT